MPYRIVFSPGFEKSIGRIKRRDFTLFLRIQRKMAEIVEDPAAYKHLRNVLKGSQRVHVGSFVIVFNLKAETIVFEILDHHDRVYGR